MDKYKLVLDIVEHPENYTSEKIDTIMSDPEARGIYNLLCKTDSAIRANKETDVDTEWEKFVQKKEISCQRNFMWFGNRAASVAAIIGASVVAVAAGIAVTVSMTEHKGIQIADNNVEVMTRTSVMISETTPEHADTANISQAPVMFENKPLDEIMKIVGTIYGVEVKFENKEAATLHLYYRLDPALPLEEVVSQLNTFDQINISHKGNTLTLN